MDINNSIIEKTFNQYKLKFIPYTNSITILINETYFNNKYQNSFNINYLQSFQLFILKKSIQEIIELISLLIDGYNIYIMENSSNLILMLFPFIKNIPFVELTLNKVNNYENEKKKINEEIKNSNLKHPIFKNPLSYINKNKTKQILSLQKSIKSHNKKITSLSIFPSGKIISISYDKSIKIYNSNFIIIQNITEAHMNEITCLSIKDENNFLTGSLFEIITWIKKENFFYKKEIIENAHSNWINKVIYLPNYNLISCSSDSTIKIWNKIINKYQLITTIKQMNEISSLLYIENKNILISTGINGTYFWKIKENGMNIFLIFSLIKIYGNQNCLTIINDDKIIIGMNNIALIFSFSEKQIINKLNLDFEIYGILNLQNKGIFLICGNTPYIYIFNNSNYLNLGKFKDYIYEKFYGLCELNNEFISSYSFDGLIKVWKINV